MYTWHFILYKVLRLVIDNWWILLSLTYSSYPYLLRRGRGGGEVLSLGLTLWVDAVVSGLEPALQLPDAMPRVLSASLDLYL